MNTIIERIAEDIAAQPQQVAAAITLLDTGATVPFIARYRKEATQGLDDTQLRNLEERLHYLRELETRRTVILESIQEQGKLTPELETHIREADTKTRLEDLYLPYKPKRRTKAQIAREAGLEPLAQTLLQNPTLEPEPTAHTYLNPEKQITEPKQALDGARQILMETFAEQAELIGELREYLWENADLVAKCAEGKEIEGAKFSDYFHHREPLKKVPSHRALAMFRGRNENILHLNLLLPAEDDATLHETMDICELQIAKHFNISQHQRPADKWLLDTVRQAWRYKIRLSLEIELLIRLKELAEQEAIKVFGKNLHDLLLTAPAGSRNVIGLDPGLRTGVKIAIIDKTGKLLQHGTIFPHPPKNEWDKSLTILAELAKAYDVELISIGNGTASRETDKLVTELIKKQPELHLQKMVVSEAGASVYSASELAAQEFPELDVTFRGAVSIARRLQDPLAELVKIDPKAIGIGQYQHDVNQTQLARTLETVVEDCVNAVGVDVNTASASLLAHISGLNAGLAKNIVTYRDANGIFLNRDALRKVPRLGEKTFEQAAGFLRIPNGNNPLDASAVHPEAYPIIERIVKKCGRPVQALIGDSTFLRNLNPADFTDEHFGIPTVTDILRELEKPGRDPRPEFKTATFQENVNEIEDLKIGMVLEGTVTNVTNFGAFVDIGVHQDGLVHISALSQGFVKDPHDVVKAGDIIKVKVLDIDIKRRRVALTMRLSDDTSQYIPPNQRDKFDKTKLIRDKNLPRKPPAGQMGGMGTFGNMLAQAIEKSKKNPS